MRVLQICPLWFPVSADASGGRETMLFHLCEELIRNGWRVTALATGDSRNSADLVPVVDVNLVEQAHAGTAGEYAYYEQHQLWLAIERAPDFDVIHSHVGPGAYALSAIPGLRGRVLHTVHTPVYADHEWFVRKHPDLHLSTVSEFQARKLRRQGATRCHVIPNGIPVESFTFRERSAGRLLFVGRIEPQKGPDLAVQLARSLDRPLDVAGPIIDEHFFNSAIRPYIGEQIRYLGIVDHRRKDELFGKAACLIAPFRGDESFGLVAIEAMACGTPVVALANGALPEIVEPGLTGFVTLAESALPELVLAAMSLDRKAVRERVRERFHISAITRQYLALYEQIAVQSRTG